MSNLIDRQAAIDTLHMDTSIIPYKKAREYADATILEIRNRLEKLPPVQPEIIRCKNCKYQDENWRRVSVRWLPCMDMRTGSNWYCGSAERGE